MFKFVHFRYRKSGALVTHNKRMVLQKGGFTVALLEKDNTVSIGIARCSANDSYNKKIGRHLSTKRATWAIDSSDDKYMAVFSNKINIPKTVMSYIEEMAKVHNKEVLEIDTIRFGESGITS